jgi:hypothetical protein
MIRSTASVLSVLAALGLLAACGGAEKAPQTGFLSDYSNLEKVDDNRLEYRNPNVSKGTYKTFIVDKFTFNLQEEDKREFNDAEIAEIAEYAHANLVRVISKHFQVVSTPGAGVARVRSQLTDLEKAQPLMNVHPLTRATGGGRGGAAIEGEIVDSVTGEQLFAIVRRTTGEFASGSGMTSLADIKTAIDIWAESLDKKIAGLK